MKVHSDKILPFGTEEFLCDDMMAVEDDPPVDAALNLVVQTQTLPKEFEEGTNFFAVITQVNSPSQFWFNIYAPGHFDTVTQVMDEMDRFYNSFVGKSYKIGSGGYLTPGSVIAARYRSDGYHRAAVIKLTAHKMVKLVYIDYGTQDVQKLSHCRYLRHEWAELPGQAIEGHLFGVVTKRGVEKHVARDSMVKLTTQRPGTILAIIRSGVNKREMVEFEAETETLVEYSKTVSLTLIDALAVMNKGLNINDELVRMGVCDKALIEKADEGWKAVTKAIDKKSADFDAVMVRLDKLVHPEDEILKPSLYLKLLRIQEINLKLTINLLKKEKAEEEMIAKYENMWEEVVNLKDEVETKEMNDHIDKLHRWKMLKTLKTLRRSRNVEKK